jgi:hypothetical protein
MASLDAARNLVTQLLRELDPQARLIEFEETVNGRHFALRIDTPDDVGKTVMLPKRAVLTAVTQGIFGRNLRSLLRSALEIQRTRRTRQEAHDAVAGGSLLPPCPRCLRPIAPRAPVIFEHGEVCHLDCPS